MVTMEIGIKAEIAQGGINVRNCVKLYASIHLLWSTSVDWIPTRAVRTLERILEHNLCHRLSVVLMNSGRNMGVCGVGVLLINLGRPCLDTVKCNMSLGTRISI